MGESIGAQPSGIPGESGREAALSGTWELLAFDIEEQESGQRQPFYQNANSSGYLIATPEGRLMVLIVSGGREPAGEEAGQAALLRTMVSYTGRYRCEGERLITDVDVSWNETWTGTEQVRFYELDGDRLDIVTAWMPHPFDSQGSMVRGILSWQRVG